MNTIRTLFAKAFASHTAKVKQRPISARNARRIGKL